MVVDGSVLDLELAGPIAGVVGAAEAVHRDVAGRGRPISGPPELNLAGDLHGVLAGVGQAGDGGVAPVALIVGELNADVRLFAVGVAPSEREVLAARAVFDVDGLVVLVKHTRYPFLKCSTHTSRPYRMGDIFSL